TTGRKTLSVLRSPSPRSQALPGNALSRGSASRLRPGKGASISLGTPVRGRASPACVPRQSLGTREAHPGASVLCQSENCSLRSVSHIEKLGGGGKSNGRGNAGGNQPDQGLRQHARPRPREFPGRGRRNVRPSRAQRGGQDNTAVDCLRAASGNGRGGAAARPAPARGDEGAAP